MATLPTGTVTFLFTDIEGRTKLAQEHPDHWESMWERQDAQMLASLGSVSPNTWHEVNVSWEADVSLVDVV